MENRMVIISSFFKGESYGILGPQMAASIINENTDYDCRVVAVARDDDKKDLKKALYKYFGKETPVIGFSTLSGREDLFGFAKEMKDEGAITFLAGPQSDIDFSGEVDWQNHSHRFKGLSNNFDFAIHGPAEQAISLLAAIKEKDYENIPGILYKDEKGIILKNAKHSWDENYMKRIDWSNLYVPVSGTLSPIRISLGQVLQQIGCPHAANKMTAEIDYPADIEGKGDEKIEIKLKGCSFCDVAVDKGFYGELKIEAVLEQIASLPDDNSGRKIPFELINENPLPGLPKLLKNISEQNIKISQIQLILRADWLVKGEKRLREALKVARGNGVQILAASVGFEAFNDRILINFNKGTQTETNLKAVRLMRALKDEFPDEWAYSKKDGSIHGFIHPTPWDTNKTFAETQKNIAIYGLDADILPPNSIPLIIYHGSFLGDWIREVEAREGIKYKRFGSVIGWWEREQVNNELHQ